MDNDAADDVEKVTIMTIHAAKGLEFDNVFLPGWEEGVFPSQRSLDEGGLAALEEERRLAYVAITRARKRCTILHAANRRKCDAIVMGTHGRTGLARALVGSVAEKVLRHARCPVVTVKDPLPAAVAEAAAPAGAGA